MPQRTHGMALALRGRCPFCAEVTTAPSVLSGAPCTVCGGAFDDPSFADFLLEDMARLSKDRFVLLLGIALGLSLASCVPGIGWLISFCGTFGAFMGFRILVVNPALALMSKSRRRVANWTVRLILASVLALMSMLLVTPGASLLASGIAVAVAWWSARAYILWQLRRERAGLPVQGSEYGILIGLLGALLVAFLIVASLLAWAAWVITGVMEFLS